LATDLTVLKLQNELFSTDAFVGRYRILNHDTGAERPRVLEDHYADFARLQLRVEVPEEVLISWTQAQHLAIYGFFCRSFLNLSHQQALFSLELALRLRLPELKRPGLRAYLVQADDLGLLDKEALLAKNRLPDVQIDPDGPPPYTGETYWPVLLDALTGIRNHYAHGFGGFWPEWGVGMDIARLIIEQVYSAPAPWNEQPGTR
jgi:hypothetical protein